MGKIRAVNVNDSFGKATDEAIRKALELVKSERANVYVVGKRGRPTKYDAKLCKLLPAMFANGESVSEVCAELGITKETFFQWEKLHPDFSDSYKKGKELSEAWWAKLGRSGAMGRAKIQPATWIFNMKNRFGWTDRVEQVVSMDTDATVANMTPEERRKRIAELQGRTDEP